MTNRIRILAVLAVASMTPSCGNISSQRHVNDPLADAAPPVHLPLELWGAEILGQLHSTFYLPDSRLYGEETKAGRQNKAFLWPSSVQLGALIAAARVEPDMYLLPMKRYATALRKYRTNYNNRWGMDVWPGPKPNDRYYDDNAWMLLVLLELYEVSGEAEDLQWAKETYDFVMSGEDTNGGGGIYWHEEKRETKHACTVAPAIAGALRLYQLTGERPYLDTANRLYKWINDKLQDRDGLYFDKIYMADGNIETTKWSYSSALMIRANCLFWEVTREQKYLLEAQRIARAAETHWVRTSDSLIADDSKFAHKLLEAFGRLSEYDHDPHWKEIVFRCCRSLYEKCRDLHGWYESRWDQLNPRIVSPIRMIDQASAARAYWVAAELFRNDARLK